MTLSLVNFVYIEKIVLEKIQLKASFPESLNIIYRLRLISLNACANKIFRLRDRSEIQFRFRPIYLSDII